MALRPDAERVPGPHRREGLATRSTLACRASRADGGHGPLSCPYSPVNDLVGIVSGQVSYLWPAGLDQRVTRLVSARIER